MNSLVSSYLSVFSEGQLPLLHCLHNYSMSPFLWLGDNHNNSIFQSHLLYWVFFPSSVANLFHPLFVLALQTLTTFLCCHRSGIYFPALHVGFVIWLTTCQRFFSQTFHWFLLLNALLHCSLGYEIITLKRRPSPFPFLAFLFNALLCLLTFSQFIGTLHINL